MVEESKNSHLQFPQIYFFPEADHRDHAKLIHPVLNRDFYSWGFPASRACTFPRHAQGSTSSSSPGRGPFCFTPPLVKALQKSCHVGKSLATHAHEARHCPGSKVLSSFFALCCIYSSQHVPRTKCSISTSHSPGNIVILLH